MRMPQEWRTRYLQQIHEHMLETQELIKAGGQTGRTWRSMKDTWYLIEAFATVVIWADEEE